MSKQEVVLVTGITGLIGAAVVQRLRAQGVAVVGMDRTAPVNADYPVITHELPGPHRWHEVVVRYGVTRIVHAGGVSGPMLLRDDPARVCDINLQAVVDALEVCRIHGIRRMVWFSSINAYGEHPIDAVVDESFPLRPTTVYGATKAAGEALVGAYHAEHGVDAVALRVASCYGPGRTTACLIRTLVEDGLAGRVTRVGRASNRTRQFIHIDDVVDGILGALHAAELGQRSYNIAPGRVQTLDEIVAAVRLSVPAAAVEVCDDGMVWNTFPLGRLSIDAARRDFGFQPRVALETGVRRLRDALVGG